MAKSSAAGLEDTGGADDPLPTPEAMHLDPAEGNKHHIYLLVCHSRIISSTDTHMEGVH